MFDVLIRGGEVVTLQGVRRWNVAVLAIARVTDGE